MNHSPEPSWDACPDGELSRMVAGNVARRRRRTMDRLAGVAGVCVLLIAIGGISWAFMGGANDADSGSVHGGLYCSQVVELLPQYVQQSLSAEQSEQMANHLDECPSCREKHEQLLSSAAAISASGSLLLLAVTLLV